jgi:hypothetical protein
MFEVGKSYRFVWLETGRDDEGKTIYYESSIVYKIGAADGTLVKCLGPDWSKTDDLLRGGIDPKSPRDETIINTSCLFFLRAELQHDAG